MWTPSSRAQGARRSSGSERAAPRRVGLLDRTALPAPAPATVLDHQGHPELIDLVRELASELGDAEIARILNLKKVGTPHGQRWTLERVRRFRHEHQLPLGEVARTSGGEHLTASEAAEYLGISRNELLGLERLGALSRNQVTDFAPWRLTRKELDSAPVRRLVRHPKRFGRPPEGGCPEEQEKLFS